MDLPKIAVLRADVSESIGHGHISRALAMARLFKRLDLCVNVFCRNLAHNTKPYAEHLQKLDESMRVIYSDEEFCNYLEDGTRKYVIIDLLPNLGYDGLVPYLIRASKSGCILVCFDEFYNDQIKFDVVVRPFNENLDILNNSLLGLRYYVFPEELAQASKLKKQFFDVRKVLLSMGGSDPCGVSEPIVRILAEHYPKLEFTVVIGPGFSTSSRKKLELVSKDFVNIRCNIQPNSLASLYLEHDVAVTSAGLTKFETALFGLPSLILASNEREARLMDKFCKFGTALNAGLASDLLLSKFVQLFDDFLKNKIELRRMSLMGRNILDIHGGERVIDYIKEISS